MEIEGKLTATVDLTITGMSYSDAGRLADYLEDMDKKLPNGLPPDLQDFFAALNEIAYKAYPQHIKY